MQVVQAGGTDGVVNEFEAFFSKHYPRVRSMLEVYSGFSADIAEDATAEAMTVLLLRWESVKLPQAYVRAVALRVAFRMVKGQSAFLPERELAHASAADHLGKVETDLILGKAIESLPPKQREVATLALVDLTPMEMAEVLGCTPDQARANLAHARRTLKAAMGKGD
ncbi:RNA polymerase sigma factor [Streptomyces cellulosae]|uniref:RNA polymerase sigma factor n=1 Tax=Streptomyces cellulosae TaxID=1968 RepID=A0ABW7Y274_STRCE